jgi:hypothetical protein
MPTPQQSPSSLRDNHARGKAGEFVQAHLSSESSLSVVSAYFTVHAYHALKAELDRIQNLRFLFGDPQFINRLDKDNKESVLLKLARLESIVHIFTKCAAASLFSGRDGKLPSAEETPKELESEYERLTWLVIMES